MEPCLHGYRTRCGRRYQRGWGAGQRGSWGLQVVCAVLSNRAETTDGLISDTFNFCVFVIWKTLQRCQGMSLSCMYLPSDSVNYYPLILHEGYYFVRDAPIVTDIHPVFCNFLSCHRGNRTNRNMDIQAQLIA